MTVGRHDDALRHLTEARELAERFDNPSLDSASRVYLGNLAVAQGRPEEARGLLDERLKPSLAAHSTRSVTLCLGTFARLAFVEGDPERAALLAGAAEGLRRRVGLQAWPLRRGKEAELAAQLRQAPGADRFDQVSAAGSRLTQREGGGRRPRPARHRHRSALMRGDGIRWLAARRCGCPRCGARVLTSA
jgi:ATP/maltotriose-dependent transcriptional regulator MalT